MPWCDWVHVCAEWFCMKAWCATCWYTINDLFHFHSNYLYLTLWPGDPGGERRGAQQPAWGAGAGPGADHLRGQRSGVWRRPPLQLLQGFTGGTLMISSTTSSRIQRLEFDEVLLYNSEVRVCWCPRPQLLQGFRGESLVCGALAWGCSSAGSVSDLTCCWHAVFAHGPLSTQTLLKTWCPCRPVHLHGQTSVHALKTQALAAACLKTFPFTKQ